MQLYYRQIRVRDMLYGVSYQCQPLTRRSGTLPGGTGDGFPSICNPLSCLGLSVVAGLQEPEELSAPGYIRRSAADNQGALREVATLSLRLAGSVRGDGWCLGKLSSLLRDWVHRAFSSRMSDSLLVAVPRVGGESSFGFGGSAVLSLVAERLLLALAVSINSAANLRCSSVGV